LNVVVDTNVIVSAAISPAGNPARVVRGWLADRFVLITSAPLLDEIERALRRRRVQKFISLTPPEMEEFLALVRARSRIVSPSRAIDVVTDDPDDNRVLEAAVEGNAGYIVTGDRELLELRAYEGIYIVTPAQFATMLAAEAIE
jgi:putative PIN family toxin of toxin-antitoxin system